MTETVGSTSYQHDPLGNRLTKTLNGTLTTYGYDRADRITTAGSTTYSVNANGNETARGPDTFSYDQANRLTSVIVGGTTSTYSYDGDGKRSSKTVGGTTTTYAYDIGGGLPVLLDDGARKYVWGAGGLAYTVDKSTATVQVYHTDGLGSVRAITDSTANVVQTYQTDEFGIPTATLGSSTQPFGYTGEQRDPEDGLLYLRARMYEPGIARFAQRDAFAGGIRAPASLNRSSYASNNPMTRTDPSGHCWGPAIGFLPGCIGAVIGAAGGAFSYVTSIAQMVKPLTPGSSPATRSAAAPLVSSRVSWRPTRSGA